MKTDELRRSLDDLAGEDPEVEAAFAKVTGRARQQRNHFRLGLVAAVVLLVIAGTAVNAAQFGSKDHRVSVIHNSPAVADINDLTWKRVVAPMEIQRIVTTNGKTFALRSPTDDGLPNISELDANGEVVSSVDPTASYDVTVRGGAVNDLVGVPGALIAVGQTVGSGVTRDAWRSTDSGRTWQGARIATTPAPDNDSTMIRVLASKGRIYAVGTPSQPGTTGSAFPVGCPISVWTSTDRTNFRLMSGELMCGGAVDAAAGPNGVVITTSDNATAWTRSGGEWSPHPISPRTPATVHAVDGNERGYVAVGSFRDEAHHGRGAIWWSRDGRSWTRVATTTVTDSRSRIAELTGVAHSAAGWVAVGYRSQGGRGPSTTDAVLWTSRDGRHWSEDTRDHGAFASNAAAEGVGATADGFAVFGGLYRDPIKLADVLWLGSYSSDNTKPGTIEGTLRMVGGPSGAPDQYVGGTMTATAEDGRVVTATVGPSGRFSKAVLPGSYNVVGHSPSYDNGTAACIFGSRGPATVRSNEVTHIELVCSRD